VNALLPAARTHFGAANAVTAVDAEARRVTLASGATVAYDSLVSTLPLDILLRQLGQAEWADGLTHSSSHIIGVGIRGARVRGYVRGWIHACVHADECVCACVLSVCALLCVCVCRAEPARQEVLALLPGGQLPLLPARTPPSHPLRTPFAHGSAMRFRTARSF
jgi:hypothetical protein